MLNVHFDSAIGNGVRQSSATAAKLLRIFVVEVRSASWSDDCGCFSAPAASRYRDRAADDGAVGSGLLQWKRDLERHWSSVRFVRVRINTHDGQHFFRADFAPGSLTSDHLRVELYANSVCGHLVCFEVMDLSGPSADSPGAFTYSAQVSATRPASDCTPRIVPHHPNALVPLEASQIIWQR